MRTPSSVHTQATVVKPMGLRRLGTRRLSWAHVALQTRPQVTRLAQGAVRTSQDALSRELGCPVQVDARLTEAVVMPTIGLAHSAAFALVELSATGGTAVLELDSSVLLAVLDRLSGTTTKLAPVLELTRLEEASFAFVALSVLSALRGDKALQGLLGPRLTGVTVSRAEALTRLDVRQRHVGVELNVTVGQTAAGGRLLLPAKSLELALTRLPMERALTIAPEVLAARLSMHARLGCSSLSNEALASLGTGDVILFSGVRWSGGRPCGPGRLLRRGFECAGEFTPGAFSLSRVHGRGFPQESDMVTAVESRSEGLPPLPVEVEIELSRVMLPLSELAALKPGALLPLRINPSEPVLLRVGDRAVARAELVDIEGEVGARILCLLP